MSKAQKSSPDESARSKSAAGALPQGLINLLRAPIGLFSHLMWQVEHKGVENIPPDTGIILASNHQSYGDPVWLSLPIKRPIRYLAWSEAFSWPVVGDVIRLLGAWPLQIEGSDPGPIRRSISWLRGGGVVVIFPEGGRGLPDGSMMRMKVGAVRMAMEAGVPILPVTIRGASKVWPSNKRLPRLGKVEVIYHPLFHIQQLPGEEPRACARRETERLAAVIRSALT